MKRFSKWLMTTSLAMVLYSGPVLARAVPQGQLIPVPTGPEPSGPLNYILVNWYQILSVGMFIGILTYGLVMITIRLKQWWTSREVINACGRSFFKTCFFIQNPPAAEGLDERERCLYYSGVQSPLVQCCIGDSLYLYFDITECDFLRALKVESPDAPGHFQYYQWRYFTLIKLISNEDVVDMDAFLSNVGRNEIHYFGHTWTRLTRPEYIVGRKVTSLSAASLTRTTYVQDVLYVRVCKLPDTSKGTLLVYLMCRITHDIDEKGVKFNRRAMFYRGFPQPNIRV